MIEIVSYGRARPQAAARAAARTAKPSESRVAWADTAKGICIILVVMMHSTLGVGAEMGGEGYMHWLVAFAKPFRMPDFFLVSGLFLARVIDRDWRSYADKRVVHFVYFYVLWLVIQSLFKFGSVSGGTVHGFVHHLAVSLVEPYSTLWFIYILAVFSVVTKLLRRVSPPILLAAGAALEIMPVETGSFLVNEFCERWVYFLAGYLFAAHVFQLAEWARTHSGRAVAALTGWALFNGALALTHVEMPNRTTLAELPVLGLVTGVAGALAIIVLASLLSRTRLAAPLRYCGSNSISIYLTFFLPMAATRYLLIKTGLVQDIGNVSAIVTACGVLVPLLVERLVRDTRFAFLYRRPAWAHIAPAKPVLRLQPAE